MERLNKFSLLLVRKKFHAKAQRGKRQKGKEAKAEIFLFCALCFLRVRCEKQLFYAALLSIKRSWATIPVFFSKLIHQPDGMWLVKIFFKNDTLTSEPYISGDIPNYTERWWETPYKELPRLHKKNLPKNFSVKRESVFYNGFGIRRSFADILQHDAKRSRYFLPAGNKKQVSSQYSAEQRNTPGICRGCMGNILPVYNPFTRYSYLCCLPAAI